MTNKRIKPTVIISRKKKPEYALKIGLHTFRDRILDKCVYVDKTEYIYELINRESACFLSRPRRFGKSLLISTFKEIFSGSKELFKDCWIYDQIDWEQYPIIHLDFLKVDYKNMGLEQALGERMNQVAREFNIQLTMQYGRGKLAELIEILAKNKKVVVLIDEYDKPIIDYMEDIPQAEKHWDILKDFYSILKAEVDKIKFLFITGVSKFSKISVFSDLNHLNDLTLHPKYSQLLGYTLEEIEYYFAEYITLWENRTGQNRQILFKKLKDYYNGYSWDGINFVYNPFSILSFFGTYQFDNYWFATGSPTFLVNILKKSGVLIDRYDGMSVSRNFFEKFDIRTIGVDNISSLLFQTGYLTIKKKEDEKFLLSYPNREVRTSFLQYLLEGFSNISENDTQAVTLKIKQALDENQMNDFIQCFKTLLSSIPYNIQIENREAYYHSIIYVALQLSLLDVQAEIQTAFGRTDIIVSTARYIYIIEFKMGNAKAALNQIEEKQYYAPYLGKNKPVFLVGIGFDETKRNIGDWMVKEAPGALPVKPEMDDARKAEKRQMVLQMLADKLPIDVIVKYSGLTVEEIQAL